MAEENKNLNMEAKPLLQEQAETKPTPVAAPQGNAGQSGQHKEMLFFNVMPTSFNQGEIVQPKIKISQESETSQTKIPMSKKKKVAIILTAIFCGVGIIGYASYYFFGKNSYKQDSILADRSQNPPPAANQPPVENFTTPQEWREKYFSGCADKSLCGDQADPDRDGLTNEQEFKLNTDPNNPDSDQDGLADGDEVAVFLSDPTNSHTAKNEKYNDADFVRDGYDITSNNKMTQLQINALSAQMKEKGLHQPTLTTLGDSLLNLYNFTSSSEGSSSTPTPETASSTVSGLEGVDMSIEAKQDRDAQRSSTIKNIESALVKYYSDNKFYPKASNFTDMFAEIKPYLKIATNPADPINKDPYVYGYSADSNGLDFSLTFFIEVGNQIIKKHAADAQKDAQTEQADIYDDQRKNDLENLRTALLLYSNKNIAGNQDYVFPSADKFKTSLVPELISAIPKDPKTNEDYLYQVAPTFNTFTLKVLLDNPPVGKSGYLCNQEECRNY